MNYEYDFQDIGLTEPQKRLVDMGLANIDELDVQIRELLNNRAKDGWEPLYPFSVPKIWFRRQMISKQKAKKK